MSIQETALERVEQYSDQVVSLSKAIWEHPEIGLKEHYASTLLADELEKNGFTVTRGVGEMPTAFVAEWGEGKPIIGLLAEYDALPGISQKVSAVKEAVEEGAPGHGCGHNLYGAGVYGAVLAVRDVMEKEGIKGTLRFYGCPAEETLTGKVYMARAGVYDDLDAALTWHPMHFNMVMGAARPGKTFALAMNSFKVRFTGRSAHAAANPQQGRSALKAAMLLDTGVHYMREHIPPEARVHSVITDGGGAPNVVPPFSEIWYYIRAPKRDIVEQIYAWVKDIIEGAALMTQTSYEIDFLTGCYEVLSNYALGMNLNENLHKVGDLKFTEEEYQFAKDLVESVPPAMLAATKQNILAGIKPGTSPDEIGEYLNEKPLEPDWDAVGGLAGSTDVADVSFITPTAQITTATYPIGTPSHSWQSVASSGSSIGFKATVHASKVLALSTLDLFTQPDLLQAAREEFMQSTGGKKYVSPLPEDAKPH